MKNTGYTVVHKADIVPCPCGAGSLAGTLRKKKKSHMYMFAWKEKKVNQVFPEKVTFKWTPEE